MAVPVRKFTPPKAKPDISKVSEEVEEKKEEVKEGKSIWSSFTDVLKKPPRQIARTQPVVEVKEVKNDEDPPKLTLFDLVKHKSMK